VADYSGRTAAKIVDADPAPPAASDDSSIGPSETSSATAEGRITELICGKPPEVLLTLATEKDQMLLHVADISKIEIQAAGQVSNSSATPCAQWKDRKAKVTFDLTPDGTAHGELRSIAFF
jgi:hypothetical protein